MDPIKVDFTKKSDQGPDKKTGVVIPPEKKGLKIVINLLLTAVFGAVLYYFLLPAFNFKSILMYAFLGALCVFYCIANYVTSGALKTPDYAPYARKSSLVPKILIGVLLAVVAVGFIVSSVVFRASSYAEIIDVQTGDFAQEVDEADFSSVPVIDEATTAVLAQRAVSDLDKLGYVSQFDIQPNYFQINYKDSPVRVVPLQYSNIIKWLTNAKNGLPAYVIVDARTQEAELMEVKGGMKYSTADHFNDNVIRHVRFNYPTYLLDTPTFEIDEEGHPYWIFAKLDMTIGLFGGRDVTGAIICDSVTGECNEYSIEEIRTKAELQWIDRIYSAELLNEQYNFFGRYQGGFWNSILSQKNTYSTTEDYSYLAMNDDVYMYTGVTSLTNDESITGFILINQRTKEAKYYVMSGAKEASAQASAQGLVQQYEYTASFPLLLNIDGVPTYFMSLKDASSLVKGYAMINVGQYTLGTTGSTLEECINNYVKVLSDNNIKVSVNTDGIDENMGSAGNAEEKLTATGVITDIRTAVVNGNSVYYIKLDSADCYYSVKAADAENIVLVNKGDEVTFTITTDEGSIIPASALEVK
ncbi:MAG: CvpA family protein [Acutalibacteraceae bacterium]|nr:CvpA family protein [Acutalibacteraceae bacterium]